MLFIQHVLKSMKEGSVCGIVLDEGVLFRTNEGGFVGTKRKLMEECDVYCIISLPGGVFSSAGAGVKTNLVFFRKGPPTEKIWYYDLSDVKVGKKTPLTRAAFDPFFELLPARGDSERSWTVDFSGRLETAMEEARPYREKAIEMAAKAKELEDVFRQKRSAKTDKPEVIKQAEEAWKAAERAARENQSKAQEIEDAAFDLKAVNPNRKNDEDTRTPAELLVVIAEKGREADAALERLRHLIGGQSRI